MIIYTIVVFFLGFFIERRFSPKIKVNEKREIVFRYTAKKGMRNEKKLFQL